MSNVSMLAGGSARRTSPQGLIRGVLRAPSVDPSQALALVADDLAQTEVELRRIVESDVRALPQIAHYLADSGGKRLRPALTALGARAVGVESPSPVLMCCGELIHLGSLLHDDVVDDGETRRGRPSAQMLHGNAVAVLTGDHCVARALLAAIEHGGAAAGAGLARTVSEMSEGEVLQLQRAGNLDVTVEAYLEVITRKSASLVAWCSSVGALAIGDTRSADALARFGHSVGIAFQIADDVLDFAEGTGKRAGADLRERKITLPILHALGRVPGLKDRLRRAAPTEDELPGLFNAVRDSGALDLALADAHGWADNAVAALQELPPTPARDALEVLAAWLVERTV